MYLYINYTLIYVYIYIYTYIDLYLCAWWTAEGVQGPCGVLQWLDQKELSAPEHYQDQRAGGGLQEI